MLTCCYNNKSTQNNNNNRKRGVAHALSFHSELKTQEEDVFWVVALRRGHDIITNRDFFKIVSPWCTV